jgi:hypothetical protein
MTGLDDKVRSKSRLSAFQNLSRIPRRRSARELYHLMASVHDGDERLEHTEIIVSSANAGCRYELSDMIKEKQKGRRTKTVSSLDANLRAET